MKADICSRVSKIVFYIAMAVSVALIALFFFVGFNDTETINNNDMRAPQFTDALIYWIYALTGITVVLVVLFGLISFGKNFKDDPLGALKGLAGLLLLVVLFGGAYFLASDTPIIVNGKPLSDSDGNLTNTVQESSIIPIHIGTVNSIKVRMGMQDENSDKQVSFTLSGIDSGFDYVRVFYERSSSGNDGAVSSFFYMIDQNYPIIGNKAEIVITGEETILGVSKSDLQNEFADISAAKSQIVLHNILFMGNIQSTNYDYNKL